MNDLIHTNQLLAVTFVMACISLYLIIKHKSKMAYTIEEIKGQLRAINQANRANYENLKADITRILEKLKKALENAGISDADAEEILGEATAFKDNLGTLANVVPEEEGEGE